MEHAIANRQTEQKQSSHQSKRSNTQGQAEQQRGVSPAAAVMQLQPAVGNQAVLQMINQGMFSEKKEQTSTSGSKLPKDVQAKMEHSFQTDFSNVTIHQDAKVKEMGARAYAQGQQIHFAPGEYSPHTQSGQSLLGHELAHVVQQGAGQVSTPQGKGLPIVLNPALEREADQAGEKAARGALVSQQTASRTAQSGAAQPAMIGAQLSADQAPIQAKFNFGSILGGIKKAGQMFIDNGGLEIVGGAISGGMGAYNDFQAKKQGGAAEGGQQEGGGGLGGLLSKGMGLLGGLFGGGGGKEEATPEAAEAVEAIAEEAPAATEDDDMIIPPWLFAEEEEAPAPAASKTASSATEASSSKRGQDASKASISKKAKKAKGA